MAITESPEMNLKIINIIPTTITIADNNNLNRIPEDHEVKSILFSMAKDKAPGPDGFPSSFFQANWDIVGEDLIKMPAFIPGRQIVDNIAIAHETIHYMRTRRGQKGNKGSMRIKIDMAKAFDRVYWKFLIIIMGKIGFNSDWCNKIMQCISTTSTVVLINGSPDKFFNPSRGLRQGDPLSSYLFLFCMEALSRTYSHVEDLGIISGVQICKNAPFINHLLFTDDCMVFCKANLSEAQNLKDILNLFGNTSGQLINFSKSGVFFSKNTDPALMPNICNLLGVQALPINDKYLGSPLFTHKIKIQSFKPGVEKMKINLSSWKNSPLNPAGREVVIKSVTSTASIYQMNCFRIPKQICQDMNKLQRDFFWGKNLYNPTGYYPKAWTTICKPKDIGGLGFMNMELFNSAMITKIGWRLEQDKDSLWYQLMDAKYLLGRNVLNMDTKAKDGESWIWKGILEGIQNIQQHCVWRIDNGNKINIWEDLWLPNSTDKLSKPANCPNNTQFLAHLMTDQKEWNLQFIQQLFIPDIAQDITNLAIHPREEDNIHWNLNSTGKFSVKALYKSRIENLYRNDLNTRNWSSIWNMEVAPAIKIFLWKCAHEILPTNAKTASILHYIDLICKIYNSGEETMTHLFLNCPAAVEVWHQMLGENHGLFDHHTRFMDWFNTWFHNPSNNGNNCTYATTCWFFWKARFDLVFQNITPIGNYVDSRGHTGQWGAGGADLAFSWAKDKQHINIKIHVVITDILEHFNALYIKAIKGRFSRNYHREKQLLSASSFLSINHVTFFLTGLKLLHRTQNLQALNLAIICKNYSSGSDVCLNNDTTSTTINLCP
ncbi:uncharacterized protein LOC113295170 [Papaver somniferum]|uniref:uncharacterized protein LOC113295170 n=1 Tax=Papaver somniferum TaxID=3469 RepID=UPI000E70162B|nr:uncharacterized protein LOC113295170 [Papaver somniferum]